MDLTFTITGATIGAGLAGLAGYLMREKLRELTDRRRAFEAHIKFCGEKEVVAALLEQRLVVVETAIQSGRKTIHWLGDCMMVIAAKLDIELPERPM